MSIVTVGIDIAKNVFAVHGVDEAGKVQLRQPKVARGKLNALIAELPPCTIGIEACTGAHAVGRRLERLVRPRFLGTADRMHGLWHNSGLGYDW